MRNRFPFLAAAALLLAPALRAQVPQLISYQGRVAVSGVNFNGTGSFSFALVDPTGAVSYWSNDGTNLNGTQPATAVRLTVTNGLYSVLLGDTTLANMTAIPASVFANSSVWLRVWFNDGTHGPQQLAPDQRIASVGYAIVAGSVTNGAVGLPQLGLGTVSGQITCNVTDPAHTYVYLQGTSSLAYVGTPSAGSYPFQLTLVAPGSYTLVVHQSNGTENSIPVTVAAGQTVSGINLAAVDTGTDVNNCGACGNVCTGPDNGTVSCVSGTCQSGCTGVYTNCNGNCASLFTDSSNCGACGQECPLQQVCNSGACSCPPNLPNNCDGVCVNSFTDVNNCGACATVCPNVSNGSPVCSSGVCISSCNGGFTSCNGTCVNTATDNNNCGSCATSCGTGRTCLAGACQCTVGLTSCIGSCVNTQTNPLNCGGCGIVCGSNHSTPACTAGTCTIASCSPGWADCDANPNDGCEVNIQTDVSNCGACGIQCPNGHSCIAGACN